MNEEIFEQMVELYRYYLLTHHSTKDIIKKINSNTLKNHRAIHYSALKQANEILRNDASTRRYFHNNLERLLNKGVAIGEFKGEENEKSATINYDQMTELNGYWILDYEDLRYVIEKNMNSTICGTDRRIKYASLIYANRKLFIAGFPFMLNTLTSIIDKADPDYEYTKNGCNNTENISIHHKAPKKNGKKENKRLFFLEFASKKRKKILKRNLIIFKQPIVEDKEISHQGRILSLIKAR